jgi:hypothetical protein
VQVLWKFEQTLAIDYASNHIYQAFYQNLPLTTKEKAPQNRSSALLKNLPGSKSALEIFSEVLQYQKLNPPIYKQPAPWSSIPTFLQPNLLSKGHVQQGIYKTQAFDSSERPLSKTLEYNKVSNRLLVIDGLACLLDHIPMGKRLPKATI